MCFLFFTVIAYTANIDKGAHVRHKRFKTELNIALQDKPDTKQTELAEGEVCHVVAVQAKVILYPVIYPRMEAIIIGDAANLLI